MCVLMQYIPTVDTKKKCGKGSGVNVAGPVVLRIQDRPLQEMRDEGKWVRGCGCVWVCVWGRCGWVGGVCVGGLKVLV